MIAAERQAQGRATLVAAEPSLDGPDRTVLGAGVA
jgi:hypothetical protein